MQRVVSINLNGNVYQLEENGYNALFAYLDAYDAHSKDDPGRAQKLADLEARVAELCKTYLSPHKNVVTSIEIERVIAELGPLPGSNTGGARTAAASETASASTSASASSPADSQPSSSPTSSAPKAPRPYPYRRLFQIREGCMISGICVGLAEYLHIDVTIIRIMWVIFALVSGGWGIVPYAILMFVIPRVDTRAQADAAQTAGASIPHRWPWDDGWPWDKHGWPWDPPRPPNPTGGGTPQGSSGGTPPNAAGSSQQAGTTRHEARAARLAHQPVGSWWGMFSMILFVAFAFFWLSMWTHGGFFFGWPFFWGMPHWIGILVFLLVIKMVFMPYRMSRWYGYGYGGYGSYAHPHYAWAMMWNGVAWFAMMIFGVWIAYHLIPEFHDFIRSFQTGYHYRYQL